MTTPSRELPGFYNWRLDELDKFRQRGADFDRAWFDFFGTPSPGCHPNVVKLHANSLAREAIDRPHEHTMPFFYSA